MKFDSPLFDRIRVKPDQDRRLRAECPVCEWPGCTEAAGYRAPKGRGNEGKYWQYCLEHVRTYNQSYNYFAGMSDDAVARYQKDSLTGHRPTWKMGVNGKAGTRPDPNGFRAGFDADDPFSLFGEFGGNTRWKPDEASQPEGRMIRNAERKALDTMGLEVGVSAAEVKARFKELVKRHHPDANGGDRSSEGLLREVIQAYNYLKSVGYA
jgi:hypothetical protein